MVKTDNLTFINEINDAFARNDMTFLEANLADDVRWTMVGSPTIDGKASVVAEFGNMGDGPGPELTIANIVDGGTAV
ncbi:MAG: nuclear transport factor 2 family protein, partial [Thermomicrobiales bacterium]